MILRREVERIFRFFSVFQHIVPFRQSEAVGTAFDIFLEIEHDFLRRAVADMRQVDGEAPQEHDDVADLDFALFEFVARALFFGQLGQVLGVPAQRGNLAFEHLVLSCVLFCLFPKIMARQQDFGHILLGQGADVGLFAFGMQKTVDVDDSAEDAAECIFAVRQVGQKGFVEFSTRNEDEFGACRGQEEFHVCQQLEDAASAFVVGYAAREAVDRGREVRRCRLGAVLIVVRFRPVIDFVQFVEHDQELGPVVKETFVAVQGIDDLRQLGFDVPNTGDRSLFLLLIEKGDVYQTAGQIRNISVGFSGG